MSGWYLLFLLMVLAGSLACILPGIYPFVAGSAFSFVVMYEPGRGAIGRSFGLLNRQFGAALGRVLLLLLIQFAVTCLVGTATGGVAFGLAASAPAVASAGFQLTTLLIQAPATVPLTMLMLVGLLLTYTQLRAAEEEISTAQLWAATSHH